MVANLVIGWRCDACEWIFQVKKPRPLTEYGDVPREIVQGAFDRHDCDTWRTWPGAPNGEPQAVPPAHD